MLMRRCCYFTRLNVPFMRASAAASLRTILRNKREERLTFSACVSGLQENPIDSAAH